MTPTDSWLVAILVVTTVVAATFLTVRAIDQALEERRFRRHNQAHPKDWRQYR